jgi:hypothetical protein
VTFFKFPDQLELSRLAPCDLATQLQPVTAAVSMRWVGAATVLSDRDNLNTVTMLHHAISYTTSKFGYFPAIDHDEVSGTQSRTRSIHRKRKSRSPISAGESDDNAWLPSGYSPVPDGGEADGSTVLTTSAGQ